jgi:hypothetical protein
MRSRKSGALKFLRGDGLTQLSLEPFDFGHRFVLLNLGGQLPQRRFPAALPPKSLRAPDGKPGFRPRRPC